MQAQILGERGIYRSDDAGISFVRINEHDHQWAAAREAITGDPRVYGRVCLGTNGRGIIYGDCVDCDNTGAGGTGGTTTGGTSGTGGSGGTSGCLNVG